MKASSLRLKTGKRKRSTQDTSNAGFERSHLCYDPRPATLRHSDNYQDFFFNTLAGSQLNHTIPFHFIRRPANPYAIETDHDYEQFSAFEKFLSTENITQISDADIKTIELKTRGQASNSFWYEERTKRLHASSFGRICKATARTDFSKLAKSFTTIKKFDTAATLHGKKQEPRAIVKFQSLHNVDVVSCGIFVSARKPYIAGSPDGLIGDDRIVEVKCPYTAKFKTINCESVPWLNLDEHSGGYSLSREHAYYYQVQGLMYVTERVACDFVVYTISDMLVITVLRDEDFIEVMLQKLDKFFDEFFKPALQNKHFLRDYAALM